jgi:hypothetical protein
LAIRGQSVHAEQVVGQFLFLLILLNCQLIAINSCRYISDNWLRILSPGAAAPPASAWRINPKIQGQECPCSEDRHPWPNQELPHGGNTLASLYERTFPSRSNTSSHRFRPAASPIESSSASLRLCATTWLFGSAFAFLLRPLRLLRYMDRRIWCGSAALRPSALKAYSHRPTFPFHATPAQAKSWIDDPVSATKDYFMKMTPLIKGEYSHVPVESRNLFNSSRYSGDGHCAGFSGIRSPGIGPTNASKGSISKCAARAAWRTTSGIETI